MKITATWNEVEKICDELDSMGLAYCLVRTPRYVEAEGVRLHTWELEVEGSTVGETTFADEGEPPLLFVDVIALANTLRDPKPDGLYAFKSRVTP